MTYGDTKVYRRVKLVLQPEKEMSRVKKFDSFLNFGVREGV